MVNIIAVNKYIIIIVLYRSIREKNRNFAGREASLFKIAVETLQG
jgi:hypothetical protein